MKFDFKKFIEKLKKNDAKKGFIIEYEKKWGKATSLYKQAWYKEYLKKIKMYVILPNVFSEGGENIDWDLLTALIFASFSSNATYKIIPKIDELLVDIEVKVTNDDQTVVKNMSSLFLFQIARLFEIYTEEQMQLHDLKKRYKKEKISITNKRKELIKNIQTQWGKVQIAMMKYPEYRCDYEKITHLIENLLYTLNPRRIFFSKN